MYMRRDSFGIWTITRGFTRPLHLAYIFTDYSFFWGQKVFSGRCSFSLNEHNALLVILHFCRTFSSKQHNTYHKQHDSIAINDNKMHERGQDNVSGKPSRLFTGRWKYLHLICIKYFIHISLRTEGRFNSSFSISETLLSFYELTVLTMMNSQQDKLYLIT